MEFEADPDYKYLRGLLTTVLAKQNAEYDFYYDWCKEKPVVTDEFAIQRYTKNNTLNMIFIMIGVKKNLLLLMNLLFRDILKIILI